VAVAALPLLARTRDALAAAKPDRWRLPPLFFFDPTAQDEWDAVRPPADALPPAARDLLADVATVLASSHLVRRAGRAVPGLIEAVRRWADDSPAACRVAALLAIPDDDLVRAIHPDSDVEARLRVRGVGTVGQLHVLLADALYGRGLPAGPRPDPAAVAACRGEDYDADEPPVARPRFQLYKASARREDGSLTGGFAGAADWLWPTQPLAAVPRVGGERLVLLGEPVIRSGWAVERALASAEVEVLDVRGASAGRRAA
jgi:hypothetical protein